MLGSVKYFVCMAAFSFHKSRVVYPLFVGEDTETHDKDSSEVPQLRDRVSGGVGVQI